MCELSQKSCFIKCNKEKNRKEKSVALPFQGWFSYNRKYFFINMSLSKRGKWKTRGLYILRRMEESISLCSNKGFLRFKMQTPGLFTNARYLPSHWRHLGGRRKISHGQPPGVHPQLGREGEEKQRRKRILIGIQKKQKKQYIGCQKKGKLYQLLTRGQGGWGQRSQEVTGDHPVRKLRAVGPERDWGADDEVPQVHCSGVSISPQHGGLLEEFE